MLPIRDTVRSRTFPVVNIGIILANVLVFVYQISLSQTNLDKFISTFALIPAQIQWHNPISWMTFFTHIFLHGGWFHILSNLWVLFIFGDNVEDRMGSVRYLIFYLLGGAAAGLVQYLFTTDPGIPALGASGAIAAVMGAYFLFYPHARVVTLVPLFFFGWFVQLPAVVFLGIWFLMQAIYGVIALTVPAEASMGGVAWWAHIGGFIFGLLMARLFCGKRCAPQDDGSGTYSYM